MFALRLLRCSPVAVAAMLYGCAAMEVPDFPWQFMVDQPPTAPAAPQPVSVEIKNGAGHYIYAGPAGKQSANPELSLFDGTLHIKTLWSDNKYTEQTLTHRPGRPVSLGWDDTNKQHYVIPTGKASARTPAVSTTPPQGYPTRVTVRDENGVILSDGRADYDDEYDTYVPSGRPGKLFITTEWSEGPPTTQELSYTPGDLRWDDYGYYVYFSGDYRTNQLVIDPPGPGWAYLAALKRPRIELSVGAGRLKQDAPTLGVNVGPDTPLLRGAERIDYFNIGTKVALGRIGPFYGKIGLDLQWGDETNRSDTASGNRGFVFQGGARAGSTGSASATPSVASLETSYNAQKLSFLLEHPLPGVRQTGNSQIKKTDEIFITRTRFKHEGDMRFTAFPSVFAEEDWKVTEYTAGVGVGIAGRHVFNQKFAVSLGANLNALYYHGKYEGSHRYACNVCALVLQDFTQSTGDTKDGFTWGGGLTAGMSYFPRRGTEIGLLGEYQYRDKSVVFQPRITPADPTPHLRTDNTHRGALHLFLRSSF